MGHAKMSVTIPEEILREIKKIAANRQAKISQVVTEALMDKIRSIKEEVFISAINNAFSDPEVAKEQQTMANDIADNMNIEELPW